MIGMLRKSAIVLIALALLGISCGALQLKWDRDVQNHMETILTNPDEVVLEMAEEWNSQEGLQESLKVDLEFVQENIIKMEFDNKKGHCLVYYKEGMDFKAQKQVVGQCMVIFGKLYWRLPDQKRETVYLKAYLDDTETLVFSWTKGVDQPVIDSDRLQSFI
jgi:hypothetical protein